MPIVVRLDAVLAERGMSLRELSGRVGISEVNMSRLKTGKARAVRFSTLGLLCEVLDCQVGDILEYDGGRRTDDGVGIRRGGGAENDHSKVGTGDAELR